MKKILAVFSAVAFLGSTTLVVSACGVSQGSKIDIVVKDAPKKAENDQNPLNSYVYNNQYNYSQANVNYAIGVAGQLASDKIYNFRQSNGNANLWDEFYKSQAWQRGSFHSFHYEPAISGDPKEAFTFRDSQNNEFVYSLKNSDPSLDENKLMMYWFITSKDAGGAPSKDNIIVPAPGDFEDGKTSLTKTGWIHLYLIIGAYKIDFNVEINFSFTKVKVVNNDYFVMLDTSTFAQPLGKIDFNNPPYDKVLNLEISNYTPPAPEPESIL